MDNRATRRANLGSRRRLVCVHVRLWLFMAVMGCSRPLLIPPHHLSQHLCMLGRLVHKDICSLNLIMRHLRPLVKMDFFFFFYRHKQKCPHFPHVFAFWASFFLFMMLVVKELYLFKERFTGIAYSTVMLPTQHLLCVRAFWGGYACVPQQFMLMC